MFTILGIWLAGVIVSFINHNRELPIAILILGFLVLVAEFTIGQGFITIVSLTLLSVVIWIANKLDMA